MATERFVAYLPNEQIWINLEECRYCYALICYQGQDHMCPDIYDADAEKEEDCLFLEYIVGQMTNLTRVPSEFQRSTPRRGL